MLTHAAADPTLEQRFSGPRNPASRRAARTRAWVAAAATAGLAVTLLTSGTSLIDFAYASIPLHVAMETVAAMAALVAAQLASGRYRRSLELHDLLLLLALCSFATATLLFSAVPAVFDSQPGRFATWAPVGGTLVAAALLAATGFSPERTLHRPDVAARQGLLACAAALVAIAAAVVVLGDALPVAVAPDTAPTDAAPQIPTHPIVLTTQVLAMLLFAAAAAGFAARDVRMGDVLARWRAVG